MSYVTGSGLGSPPILEYIAIGDDFLCGVRVETGDNMLPFGKGSLDSHSKTFLGIGRSRDDTAEEKASTRKSFIEKPEETYKYSIVDVINAFLVSEQMVLQDRDIY